MFRALGHVLLFTPLLISDEEAEAQWLSDLCQVQGCRRWCRDMNPSRPIHVPSHHPLQSCHVTRWAQTCWQLQGGCGASPCPRPRRLALHQPAWWHWLNSWRWVGSEEEFSVGLLYAWCPPFSLNRELVWYCVCECGWLLCTFSENVPARLAGGRAQHKFNKSIKPRLPWFELHPLVKVVGRKLATCFPACTACLTSSSVTLRPLGSGLLTPEGPAGNKQTPDALHLLWNVLSQIFPWKLVSIYVFL